MVFVSEDEEILKVSTNRFVLFPIKYHDIFKLYKESLSAFWVVEECDLSIDRQHWKNRLTDGERFFIKNILAFFACSDGIVNENLALNFYNEVQIPEARNLYATQIQIEAIHSEMYSLLIDSFITDSKEKLDLFNSIETSDIVKKKAEWALKWFDKTKTFPERLLAFGIIEGVFFSGSFCAIFWLKSRGLMPGLGLSNEFISRDESMHCKTCVLLYSKLKQRLPETLVHELFREAYLIEKEFITESIPVNLIGMNSLLMIQYIEFIVDYWLVEFGYSKLFRSKNPFDFMEYLSLESKTNFFEKGVSSYSKAGAGMTEKQMTFSTEEDF
jgi:ribonucleotide reductase beta subunit family protein with ferritin-like domain